MRLTCDQLDQETQAQINAMTVAINANKERSPDINTVHHGMFYVEPGPTVTQAIATFHRRLNGFEFAYIDK